MALTPGPMDVARTNLRPTRDVVAIPRNPGSEARTNAIDAATRVVETLADQQNETALAAADIEAGRELEGIRERMLTDDDWETQPVRARTEAQALLETRGQTLRGGRTQRVWQTRSMGRLAEFEGQMRVQSRERGSELARADLTRLWERSVETAGDLTLSEQVRRDAAINYDTALTAAVRRGLVAPDAAARESARFSTEVLGRVRDGLRAEAVERQSLDPADLAAELADDEGPFRALPPDERARFAGAARERAAANVVDSMLEHTLRTGEIISDADERLSAGWDDMGPGARFNYAQRASQAQQIHALASALDTTGEMSLPEIVATAERDGDDPETWAARQQLRVIRRDPAAYVLANQPNIDRLREAASQAVERARATPEDPTAQFTATRARLAFVTASIEAQAALGLPPGDVRIMSRAPTRDWAARVRRHPPEDQQAILDALPNQMLRMYGNEDIADRAVMEHLEAYYARGPAGRDAPAPESDVAAVQGAEYDEVRGRIMRALTAGGDLDDPRIDVLMSRLTPADRRRLMEDEEIVGALGSNQ